MMIDSPIAGIGVEDFQHARFVMQHNHGADLSYFEEDQRRTKENPMLPAVMLRPVGTVVTNSMAVDRDEF